MSIAVIAKRLVARSADTTSVPRKPQPPVTKTRVCSVDISVVMLEGWSVGYREGFMCCQVGSLLLSAYSSVVLNVNVLHFSSLHVMLLVFCSLEN